MINGKEKTGRETKQRRESKAEAKEKWKKKTLRRKTGGVPWHTMCPVIFAPTVPAPGRFSFPLFHSVHRILSFSRISDFCFLILYAEPCLSHTFPFFALHSVHSVLPLSRISVFRTAFFFPSGTGRIPA